MINLLYTPWITFLCAAYKPNIVPFEVHKPSLIFLVSLQRIAVAYLVAAMCEIWLRNDEKVDSGVSLLKKYKWQW